MRRTCGHESDDVGDVVRDEGIGDALVNRGSLGRVAAEAGQSELVRADHARRHVADPNGLATEFEAEGVHDHPFACLRGVVTRPALVGGVGGGGGDEDDGPLGLAERG